MSVVFSTGGNWCNAMGWIDRFSIGSHSPMLLVGVRKGQLYWHIQILVYWMTTSVEQSWVVYRNLE